MKNYLPLIFSPSKKKIFIYSFIYILLASLCFFIEILSNKITQGTYFISVYESTFFYFLACYYLVQLIPGFAQLIIDNNGVKESWFFKERIHIAWDLIDSNKCNVLKQGDTLYLNTDDSRGGKQLFSKKMLCKGCYTLSDKQLYPKLLDNVKNSHPIKTVQKNQYFTLVKMKANLILGLLLLTVAFNVFYLNNEKPDTDFVEQVQLWQKELADDIQSDKKLFELFKVYGFYWKTQLKQFDRELFHKILNQESQQIEAVMLKNKERDKKLSGVEKKKFKQQLKNCKDKFLTYDENLYLQCLEMI